MKETSEFMLMNLLKNRLEEKNWNEVRIFVSISNILFSFQP